VKPLLAAAATETADDYLVAAVRDGSEEAFEALYLRYRPRIVGFVRSMCGDHARAEDIAQEAFMSALRGLRSSDKEIVFRPWLYEIARNACIDHMRRAGRSTEVSIDSEDFSPQEEGRVSQSISGTDAEVARRKELESLQMAFGDLPESQHQILVMRELEGLSYDRIGSRMGLSRGAVESMLFRARRTLRDGFDDIDTGERCHRMQLAMEDAAADENRRIGMRERRRLQVHLRRCAGCRRTAVTLGLDDLALAGADRAGGPFRRVAALLPLPMFLRRRLGDAAGTLNSMGPAAEQGATLAGKATVVVVAVAVAAGGAGVAHKASGGAVPLPGGLGGETRQGGDGTKDGKDATGTGRDGNGTAQGAGAQGGAGGPGGNGTQSGSGASGPAGQGGSGPAGRDGTDRVVGTDGTLRPAGEAGGSLGGAVGGTTGTVGSLTGSTGQTVDRVGQDITGKVDDTLQDVSGGTAPRLPRPPSVQLPGGDSGSGGSTSTPALPSTGDALDVPQVQVPQVPGVQLPETQVKVPGVRLP
jgi:RNA polymerase sigma factor (sigma-70 family)